MNDRDQEQRTLPGGRILHVTAYGDTADELELYALDEAREFFGTDVRLEVIDDYQVVGATHDPAASGKRYCAGVRVRALTR